MRVERDRRGLLSSLGGATRPVALVPTMGGLHDGHLRLVRRARELGGSVVVTLFVNPLQFGPSEDFAEYPRTFDRDAGMLDGLCDILFAPPEAEMYPEAQTVGIDLPALADELCGRVRPGFFRGVATVVAKLFNLVRPDIAVFGKKDYQQAVLVGRMARQLSYPVAIELCETAREADGLALSSRNAYLSAAERARAPAVWESVDLVGQAIERGDSPADIAGLCAARIGRLRELGFAPDYLEVRDRELSPPSYAAGERLVALCAATIGSCRLIDNREATYEGRGG